MKELNSAQIGTSTGAIAKLPRPVAFSPGLGCSRVRCEATIYVKNNQGTAQNYTYQMAMDALACLFSVSTLKFGDRNPEVVDNALPYARAREQFVIATHDDFLINGTQINALTPGNTLIATVAAGATSSFVAEFSRSFEVDDLGRNAYDYCPGASQMRQLQWEFIRGSVFDSSNTFVQAQACDLVFLADTFHVTDDKWASVPRLFWQEEAGRESHGPVIPSGLLALWEYSNPGASTPLTVFSLNREGDSGVHETARASRVVRDALYTLPIGAYNPNNLVTLLHSLPAASEKNEVPVGAKWSMVQTGSELAPPKTAWLYIPGYGEAELDAFFGKNIETAEGVKIIANAGKVGGVDSTHAALEPVIVAPRGSSDFDTYPGRVYQSGHAPVIHIPDAVMAGIRASAAKGKAATAVAKAVPGGTVAKRNTAQPLAGAIKQKA